MSTARDRRKAKRKASKAVQQATIAHQRAIRPLGKCYLTTTLVKGHTKSCYSPNQLLGERSKSLPFVKRFGVK